MAQPKRYQMVRPDLALKASVPNHPTRFDKQDVYARDPRMMNTMSDDDARPAMQVLVERVSVDRASLALLGPDTSVVDDFGRKLVQVLRQEAQLEVVVLFDVAEDKLLARINQRLAPLSVDEARSVGRIDHPPQVWVLQVQGETHLNQVQMLTRLIRDFPAANLSLILLSSPQIANTFLDSALGRFYVQWRLSEPEVQSLSLSSDSTPNSEAATRPEPSMSQMDKMMAGLRSSTTPYLIAAAAVLLLLFSVVVSRQ